VIRGEEHSKVAETRSFKSCEMLSL
jgi:hypothetical protein